MNVYHTQVGLDFTPRVVNNDAGKDGQRQVLIRQAEIAKQLNLPLYVSHFLICIFVLILWSFI